MADIRRAALENLAPFIGEWDLSATIGEPGGGARNTFERVLDDKFVIQRSVIEHSEVPDGLSIIAADESDAHKFTQHYFDSRGVTRVYAMTFDGQTWTLRRETADFSPLDFAQRFVGEFSPDRNTIDGRWETRAVDSSIWQQDFQLTYSRV